VAVPGQERVDSYRLVYLLRKGQTCEVWEVYREGEEQNRMAMKLLPRGSRFTREQIGFLKQEFQIARHLEHPNIIRVFDFAQVPEGAYVLMELFRAPNLKQRIQDPSQDFLYYAEEIIRGAALSLAYLHDQGWVHRDVKPDNFLVGDNGETKLIDFNLAIRRQGFLNRLLPGRNKIQGTMSYMSPEQIRGQPVDARADIYSFGCVLHEIFSGKPPFTGASAQELLTKHLRTPPPSLEAHNKSVQPAFAKLVQQMLAKDPAKRPESVREFQDRLLQTQVFRERPKRPEPQVEK